MNHYDTLSKWDIQKWNSISIDDDYPEPDLRIFPRGRRQPTAISLLETPLTWDLSQKKPFAEFFNNIGSSKPKTSNQPKNKSNALCH